MQISSLVVKIGANITELQAGLAKASKSIENVGRKMTDMGKTMSMRVTAPVVAGFGFAVKAASDAEETVSKFATVFRDVGDEAEKSFGILRNQYGLSSTAAKQLLGDTGDLLTGFGFTQTEALGLSEEVNKLAVDLASFTNFSGGAAGASAALTKALLGERESVKSLGISILEEDVKKQMAINSSKGMTFATERQAKAQATLDLAIQQSQNAIGDYARTSDSFANQTRLLQARLSDLAVEFGTILLPMATKGIQRMQGLIATFRNLNEATKRNIVTFGLVAASIGPLMIAFGGLAKAIAIALSPLALKLAAITALSVGIIYLAKNLDVLMNRFRVVFATMANVVLKQVDSMLESLGKFFGIFDTKMLVSITSARALLMTLTQDVPEIEGEFQNMGEFIQSVIADLGNAFEWLGSKILGGGGGVKQAVQEIGRSFEGATFGAQNLAFGMNNIVTSAQKFPQAMRDAAESIGQVGAMSQFAHNIAMNFTSSFGQGMANVVVQGEKLVDVLKNIGKLLLSSAIQFGIQALLTGGLGSGAGFFGKGGGLFGKIFGVNDALITSGGDVVKFHPDDNILAMKDFSGIGGGGGSQRVEVYGTIKGQDLFISSQRGSTSFNR